MKKRFLAWLIVLPLMLSLAACDDNAETAEETKAEGDWRNKIEYEGNFYVNKETKLLYALDRGTITLWDNAGDGDKLQVLEYNSAESDAIETLEIEDINGDGSNDISAVFSENEQGIKYNLWLWNPAEMKYTECKLFRTINNPVISEDKTTVTGTLDKGIFGIVTSTYTFTETLSLEPISTVVTGADAVAENISDALCGGAEVTLADGIATIQSVPCAVYAASENGKQTAYIAHTSEDACWYIDIGCVGAYKMINDTDGAFTTGIYVDEAGIITDVCAELYKCDVLDLAVTSVSMGSISAMSYDDDGNIIPSDDSEETAEGMSANGFVLSLNGEELCTMLIAKNSSYYCFDPDLTGDQYFYMVSSAGEAAIVPMTACIYSTK